MTATAATGITARVDGSNLVLESDEFGSEAFVEVSVNATVLLGLFTAESTNRVNGVDAQATIQGQTYTAQGNTFSIDLDQASFELDVTPGSTGDFGSITIESTPKRFDLSGGDGAGSSTGIDVQVEIDGVRFVGVGAEVAVSTADADLTLEFVEGFAGEFSPLTVTASNDFKLLSGTASATAFGEDSVATIDGRTVTGDGNRFDFETQGLQIRFDVVEGFVGSFEPLIVGTSSGSLDVLGDEGTGIDFGSDVQVELHGRAFTGRGSQLALELQGVSLQLSFAEGFTGQLKPITVEGVTSAGVVVASDSTASDSAELQSLAAALSPLVSGGALSLEADDSGAALELIDDLAERLTRVAQAAVATETETSQDPQATADARAAAKVIALAFRDFALNRHGVGLEAIDLTTQFDHEHRLSLLTLLR